MAQAKIQHDICQRIAQSCPLRALCLTKIVEPTSDATCTMVVDLHLASKHLLL